MEATPHRQSAKILMFPLASRGTAKVLSSRAKFEAEVASLRGKLTDFGSAWYHDEAIQDARQTRPL